MCKVYCIYIAIYIKSFYMFVLEAYINIIIDDQRLMKLPCFYYQHLQASKISFSILISKCR